jgi:hypothetical protein
VASGTVSEQAEKDLLAFDLLVDHRPQAELE